MAAVRRVAVAASHTHDISLRLATNTRTLNSDASCSLCVRENGERTETISQNDRDTLRKNIEREREGERDRENVMEKAAQTFQAAINSRKMMQYFQACLKFPNKNQNAKNAKYFESKVPSFISI